MIHVHRSGVVNATAEKVWEIVGDFDGLPAWNPPIESSTPETIDDVPHRTLKFGNGGEFFEQFTGTDGTSTSYRILKTEAPLKNYVSSISVVGLGDKCLLTWSSVFDSDNPGMDEVVGGIYQAGIDTVIKQFS